MPGRQFVSSSTYRYGFNGKENDKETVGTGNGTQDYGMRIYNPALGKFLSADPLIKKYPELTPYQFASNTPVCAIDLDGLEAFIIHGTQQTKTGIKFDKDAKAELMRIAGNTKINDAFRWDAPIYNSVHWRATAAGELAKYIYDTRSAMMKSGEITEDEGISLIGYSHGGNVSIQAAQILSDQYGIKVNIITVSTPAYNSTFNVDNDGYMFGNQEDPQGNDGINKQTHMVHKNDDVIDIAGGDVKYSNPKKVSLHYTTSKLNYITD